MKKRAALFLDRDGVINVDHGYVHRTEDFEWIPGIFETVRTATTLGLAVIVVTNQAGIARGYYDEAQFHLLTNWMKNVFLEAGAILTDVYFCAEHPDGLPPYNRYSDRRKPEPGMLLQAAQEHGIDLATSALIGDMPSDIAAARAAGLEHVALFGRVVEGEAGFGANILLPDHAAACAWLRSTFSGKAAMEAA